MENFKLSDLKSGRLTGGSNDIELTAEILVFWKSDRLDLEFSFLRGLQYRNKQNSLFSDINFLKFIQHHTGQRDIHIGLPWFQDAEPNNVQVQSSCCCFPREFQCLNSGR